jgi:hypothetical protein
VDGARDLGGDERRDLRRRLLVAHVPVRIGHARDDARLRAIAAARERGRERCRMKRARGAVGEAGGGACEAERIRGHVHLARAARHVEGLRRAEAETTRFVLEHGRLQVLHCEAREDRV